MAAPTGSATPLTCRDCGRGPAAKVTFKAVQGFVVLSRISTLRGEYCRDCGMRAKQAMNAKMLKGAWFSLTAIIAMPIYLSTNAFAAGKLNKLTV